MTENKRRSYLNLLLGIFFFGSIWGIVELYFGGALYGEKIHHASVYINIIAVVILVIARLFLNKPGTSTAIGLFAGLYKGIEFLIVGSFFCHTIAIVMLGVSFDIVCQILKSVKDDRLKYALIGFIAPALAFVSFGVYETFIDQSKYWTIGKFVDYSLLKGAIVASVSFFLVPAMYMIVKRSRQLLIHKSIFKLAYVNFALSFFVVCFIVLKVFSLYYMG